MTASKRYLPTLLLSCGLFLVLAAVVNGAVDPYRLLHADWFNTGWSENQRMQNPGLARTSEYTTALIGTSHTEQFPVSRISQILGEPAVNLSMAGSWIREQSLMAERVLAAGKARRIVWEINLPSFSYGGGVSEPAAFPFFLFQPGAETPFRYLLSWDTFRESLAALRGERVSDPDLLHRWDLESEFGADRVLGAWDFMTRRWTDDLRAYFINYTRQVESIPYLMEENVASLARAHPEVTFDLLLLPSTYLDALNDLQLSTMQLEKRLELRKQAGALAAELPNVRAWDFQLDGIMSTDYSYYKDLDHFGQGIVERILETLADEQRASEPDQVIAQTDRYRENLILFADEFCANFPDRCQAALRKNLEDFRERAEDSVQH